MIWTIDRQKVVQRVAKAPNFVQDTLSAGMIAVADGILYANSFKDLLGNEFTVDEVKFLYIEDKLAAGL